MHVGITHVMHNAKRHCDPLHPALKKRLARADQRERARPQETGYNPTAVNKDGFNSLISGMLMRDAHVQILMQVKVHRTIPNQRK